MPGTVFAEFAGRHCWALMLPGTVVSDFAGSCVGVVGCHCCVTLLGAISLLSATGGLSFLSSPFHPTKLFVSTFLTPFMLSGVYAGVIY